MQKPKKKEKPVNQSDRARLDQTFFCSDCGEATTMEDLRRVVKAVKFPDGSSAFPEVTKFLTPNKTVQDVHRLVDLATAPDSNLRSVPKENQLPHWRDLVQEVIRLCFLCATSVKSDLADIRKISGLVLHEPHEVEETIGEQPLH